jgi:hypothetical protein
MSAVKKVISEHEGEIMRVDSVTGIAEGKTDDGKSFINVFVEKLTPEIKKAIPQKLGGYSVRLEVTEEFEALSTQETADRE